MRRLLRTGAESRPALPDDVIHDLLARLIFIQFLLQRRGQAGEAALDAETLRRIFDIRSAECLLQIAQLMVQVPKCAKFFRLLER